MIKWKWKYIEAYCFAAIVKQWLAMKSKIMNIISHLKQVFIPIDKSLRLYFMIISKWALSVAFATFSLVLIDVVARYSLTATPDFTIKMRYLIKLDTRPFWIRMTLTYGTSTNMIEISINISARWLPFQWQASAFTVDAYRRPWRKKPSAPLLKRLYHANGIKKINIAAAANWSGQVPLRRELPTCWRCLYASSICD